MGNLRALTRKAHEMSRPRTLTIVCPACRAAGLPLETVSTVEVGCTKCGGSFPVRDGVIDLVPEPSSEKTFSQAFLGWKPLVRVYESRIWRRSALFAAVMGISFEQEYETIVRAARLRGDETLLDLACGPGIYTRPLARKLERGNVVGLDLSLPMLQYGRSRIEAEGLQNIVLVRGNALDLPFPDNEFDVVNCGGAIHLFPDVPLAVREVCRVLKPGGIFLAATLQRETGRLGKWRSDFRRRVYGVNSFRQDELEGHFGQAGLIEATCRHAKRAWLIMTAVKPA